MYKILVDSCGEFTEEMKNNPIFGHVALKLQVDDWFGIDDESFDQADFLRRVASSENCPKSACPAPDQYMELFEGYDEVYIVTLSGNLSGSYNSARMAAEMFLEDHENVKIHVFDSCSASIGECLIAKKIYELAESGLSFEEIVEQGEAYKLSVHTFFVLENLDTLRKNGRLSAVKAMVANTLNIKPVMSATDEGIIIQLGQKIGMRKALIMMCDEIIKAKQDTPGKPLMISHCNALRTAEFCKNILEKSGIFSSIEILDAAGISSMYANDGGVIVAV